MDQKKYNLLKSGILMHIKEEKEAAELIIKYPKPIQIDSFTYYYFVLWADKNHIEQIAQTIQFTN